MERWFARKKTINPKQTVHYRQPLSEQPVPEKKEEIPPEKEQTTSETTQPSVAKLAKADFLYGKDYGQFISALLRVQEKIISKIGGEEAAKATEPTIKFKGTTAGPVELDNDRHLPSGARVLSFERTWTSTIETPEGQEKTLPQTRIIDVVIPKIEEDCIKELPSELRKIGEAKGRDPKVRSVLACTTESLNTAVIARLADTTAKNVDREFVDLRKECEAEGKPDNCIVQSFTGGMAAKPTKVPRLAGEREVESPITRGQEVALLFPGEKAEITEGARVRVRFRVPGETPEQPPKIEENLVIEPRTRLDPLGLPLFQMNPTYKQEIKDKLCPKPCLTLTWWKK